MLGYYNYTVWLTYLSLVSGGLGILMCLSGTGHPYLGMFCLILSGLCDTFDGTVARTKKNRTDEEKKFGIQIDSLADLVAFGVLPACIGISLFQSDSRMTDAFRAKAKIVVVIVALLFMLFALIRLAYFNVTEDERQQTEQGCRKGYDGLPVTTTSAIFPFILVMQYIFKFDATPAYFIVMVIVGLAFVSKIKIPKLNVKQAILLITSLTAVCLVLYYIFR